MDVLTDVCRALRLRGTAYFQAKFRAPWGMTISAHEVANFHVVVQGECVVRTESHTEPLTLRTGDIVVFPHGAEHALADATTSTAPPADQLLSTRRALHSGDLEFGSLDGAPTEIICGHFEIERRVAHPLLDALPQTLLLRAGEGTDAQWVATATRLAVLESGSDRPGASAVVDRIAEALMIQVVRAHADAHAEDGGFLAALGDRTLATALGLIHADPAHAWSVEELARRAATSRSSFATRFKQVLGQSPMQYVTDWRMHGARELLGTRDLSIAQVAQRVGYQSEFAFAKAFKRVFGEPPGMYRRRASG
ncbi:MAG: AraC family transcriptional regulator [Deltaproteobacteria bacterium]|nr:AraC family transcriptional regulator [Deltaproteobacteria bacterium]